MPPQANEWGPYPAFYTAQSLYDLLGMLFSHHHASLAGVINSANDGCRASIYDPLTEDCFVTRPKGDFIVEPRPKEYA